jgi:hypothetical protein
LQFLWENPSNFQNHKIGKKNKIKGEREREKPLLKNKKKPPTIF